MSHLHILVLLLLYTNLAESYFYPISCEKCGEKEESLFSHTEHASDLVGLMVNSILIPISHGLCNLWVNFVEVYDCITSQYAATEPEVEQPSSITQWMMTWLGFVEKEETMEKCSYHSITIVVGSLLLMASIAFSTKKMVDYLREEPCLDVQPRGSFNKKFNICNCKLNDAVYA
ncbi:unnamed protein product [Acanthoscelides obtectus]|uniref:Uncharacterized protein n=1 Tax=Acanthoscelides obtectus TaxID=200917 RepID=A0A9P0MGX8_ACAOB|nr:unnamed protein product [Acanthoscelides obtectus]CAK1645599.1 hypothetical protein AOBTE_LOCUS14161 [Acanthoscelides obtectus]